MNQPVNSAAVNRDVQGAIGGRIARGGFWVFINRVLVAIAQLVTLILLARILSPDDMGTYFLISNLVIIGSIIVQFGIPQLVIKETAETLEAGTIEQTRSILWACLIVAVIASVIFMLILWLGLDDWLALKVFNSDSLALVMIPVGIWIIVQSIQRVVGEAFRGLHDIRLAAIFGGIFSSVCSAIWLSGLALSGTQSTLENVVYVFLWSIAASFILALYCLHKKVNLFAAMAPLEIKKLLVLAVPILIATLGNIVMTRADIWILGMYVSESEVALYGSAARLVSLLSTPLLMASAVLSPVIVQLYKQGDKAKMQRIVQFVPTLIAIPGLLMIGFFLVWGDDMLQLIYGDAFYRQAWSVLNILAVGQVLSLLAGVSIQILLMTVGQKEIMVATLLCSVLAIVVSVTQVDVYGVKIVALAFAGAIGLQSFIAVVLCKVHLGIATYVSVSAMRDLDGIKAILKERRETRRAR